MSSNPSHTPGADHAPASNFLKNIIDQDLQKPEYQHRPWARKPGGAAVHAGAPADPANIRLRFPPEPNGYLHVGHAKAICVNFGLAKEYAGACHMRFDDTNPEKESEEFANSILDAVSWLGFDWNSFGDTNLYHASDYFDFMVESAEFLIRAGLAYVDEQSAEDMRTNRGTLTQAGVNSPFRDRSVADNLARFAAMKNGELPDGAAVLRAKIDMASPNINLRDPAIYRIKHAHHHRTGDRWCIYPMYTFAHPIEDALERITHSFCTLEFEDQRPFYDWLLGNLAKDHPQPDGSVLKAILAHPLPKQVEFARLNLSYVVTSKRKLQQLVLENRVSGWDDPRMPTIVGLRRRGFTPEGIQLFCNRIGVSKSDSWIDYSVLEGALRDDLDPKAHRAVAVLDPLPLILDNVPEDWRDDCVAPVHPHHAEWGQRDFSIGKRLWIEAEDFQEVPEKKFFRLFPGNKVRLRYGYVIECTGCDKDENGKVIAVHANVFLDSKSGTPGADTYKVKGNLHWVNAATAVTAKVRLYDRLFTEEHPDAGGRNFLDVLNPNSLTEVTAYLEPSVKTSTPGTIYQFERHGYFVADLKDHRPDSPVFNRTVTLKDSWSK
ncbi:glutamine--tRNA ligase/YqeY domain fusion protein [Limnobacter humi]|uniref:Glutamine--tRNA ligase n=1 Tax=Limnobacter humi TaxID=1778671 RepID=A0ABT1WFA3_9BURK|nr:glutamine--tRNA ligase/YqeY domain fusion protein [Limnobacter humi]MCQ8895119.1 glutamine--tRNA ligase/YqeY domain fusion protein [Limnobacter humi]